MQTCGMCGNHVLVKNDYIEVTGMVEYVNVTESVATFISKVCNKTPQAFDNLYLQTSFGQIR